MSYTPLDILILKQYSEAFSKFFNYLNNFPQNPKNPPLNQDSLQLQQIGSDILLIHKIGSILNCTMGDIVRELYIPDSTASYRVDQLINKGLVTRHTPRADKRKRCLKLTKTGRSLDELFYDHMFNTIGMILNQFNENQKETILIFFTKLTEQSNDGHV